MADISAREFRDEQTGVKLRDLTPELPFAQIIYQTHPMWTQDMEYFVFNGGESKDHLVPQARMNDLARIRPLLTDPVTASVLDTENGRLYYIQDKSIYVLSVSLGFRKMASPRKIAELPAKILRPEGGISLDAKGDLVYMGAVMEENKEWAIVALNLETESWQMVTELDFRVGHVQANPSITRIILFCHETGGDAPQRTWTVRASGKDLRPFYKETYEEWVTHEVWWGGFRALFTIWPYDDVHKGKPHGVAGADLSTGTLTIHSQFPAWHTSGSPDGKWILADDFERNIWLIKADTNERRLLTQGHLGIGFDTHPHPSFTPDSKAVVFNSSRSGVEHILQADIPEWESLPKP